MSETTPPCAVVIFGAAGDLTQRLLMPSIRNLAAAGTLDPQLRILGIDHTDRSAAGWRKELADSAMGTDSEPKDEADKRAWAFLFDRLDYMQLDFTRDADYDGLAKQLSDATNILFYLAVAPRFFATIAGNLARVGLLDEKPSAFRRLVIEKPFGRDVESARRLNATLTSIASEAQIYRIDHFLGKEAVQGIPALRFGSRMFEPLLNRSNIASVQITAAETVGVEHRGAFYETTGAMRDMVPNHLLSLLTLVAMEQPRTFDEVGVRDAKTSLLDAVQPVTLNDVARGQYAHGIVEGRSVRAYRAEDDVAHDSHTETYAALCLRIDNDRWRGVPFYLRTGKRMSAHVTTITLTLRPPLEELDRSTAPHLLMLGIDPQRGLKQRIAARRPGVDRQLGAARFGFQYHELFEEPANVGYEALLYDAMHGRAMLFQRADMIDREWVILQDVLEAWSEDDVTPQSYPSGSAGPRDSDRLLARNGDRWLAVAPLDELDASDTVGPESPRDEARRHPSFAGSATQ